MIKEYEDLETYVWTPGMGEFMERMNFKASQLGMTSSSFVNPYEGQAFGFNTTTCMDLLKLGIHAYRYRIIHESYMITISGNASMHKRKGITESAMASD